MWVALQLSARLSTIVCIQGFELMTAAAAADDDDDATRFDTLKSLLTLPRHTDSGNPPHQLLYVKRYLKNCQASIEFASCLVQVSLDSEL